MARYKLPRLQKNSGSFSALPVSLHCRAWFTSALPFSAPVQPFTVPALPLTASSQCPYMAVPASWQPRGTASGVFWAYSVRTWGGEVLVGAINQAPGAEFLNGGTCAMVAVEHCCAVRLRNQTAKPPSGPRKNRTK